MDYDYDYDGELEWLGHQAKQGRFTEFRIKLAPIETTIHSRVFPARAFFPGRRHPHRWVRISDAAKGTPRAYG